MNSLINDGILEEIECGSDFMYVLNDSKHFLSTEYKVLQSQSNSGFIKCMKALYNGKVQLYYMPGNLQPLSSIAHSLTADNFMTVAAELLGNVINVKSNGFLNCQSIAASFNKIFVAPNTFRVKLIYLPLKVKAFDNALAFENALRTSLVKMINSYPALDDERVARFSAGLSDGTLSLEELYQSIKGSKTGVVKTPAREPDVSQDTVSLLRISSVNAPVKVEFEVNEKEFIIGKLASSVNGVVTFNKAISRVHCKIIKNGGQFMIVDLKSANGTFVNNSKLQPDTPHPIRHGDIIRLANSDFQVTIE